jgi:hypothetical protein
LRDIRQLLEDCLMDLKRLDQVTESVEKCEGQFLPLKKQIRLDIKSGEISLLKARIAYSRRTMQLSFSAMAWLTSLFFLFECCLSCRRLNTSLLVNLDDLPRQFQQLRANLQAQVQAQNHQAKSVTSEPSEFLDDNSRHLNTLLRCVRSGEQIASVASKRGSEMTGQSSVRSWQTIKKWIPDPDHIDFESLKDDPLSYETDPSIGSGLEQPYYSPNNERDGETANEKEADYFSRAEPGHIALWYNRGIEEIKHEDYQMASIYLLRALPRSEKIQSSGRKKILEALLAIYWNERQWDKVQATQEKLEEITGTAEERLQLWLDRAELNITRGSKRYLDDAEDFCRRTIESTRTVEISKVPKLECRWLHLLSEIFKAKGDKYEAEAWSSRIAPGALGKLLTICLN